MVSALADAGAGIMLAKQALGIPKNVRIIGGNGLNSPKLFEIAKEAGENTIIGSPWSAENATPANQAFITAYKARFNVDPDQFAAQAYDAMYVVAAALKSVKLSGNLEKDRIALRDALPAVKIDGATGKFAFRRAASKDGKETGYDAAQDAIVNIAVHGKFVLLK